MNDELPVSKLKRGSLDERFGPHPRSYDQLQAIADMMEASIAAGCSADEAERRAVEQVQKLGQALLSDWAQQAQEQSLDQARVQQPEAIQHSKKKVSWWTSFGRIEVREQLLRLGRRGKVWRPFCRGRGVSNRGYSGRLQRVLTDFGADQAFAAASAKVLEHYGIEVPVGAVRRYTLQHGKAIAVLADRIVEKPASQLISEMDGSMIPVLEPGTAPDQRKGKTLFWREVRLCSARAADREQTYYGATLGSAEVAGWVWQQTARMAGLTDQTRVHGLGDGALWILEKFNDNFARQGNYLVDFYHVSEYVAAAAPLIAPAGREQEWRRRQQGRLLENQIPKVLRSLKGHLEPETLKEAPVRAAFNYIDKRRKQLNYAGARKAGLPIGSGEVEGGHRHVIQQRLKLSGCWWREVNASAMLNLRTARANKLWNNYWAKN